MTPESRPKTLAVVGAVFTREHPDTHETEVLAFRRASHKDAAGLWEFAGGKIEPGETPEQAIVREIREELGINISVGDEILTTTTQVNTITVTITCFHVTAINDVPTESSVSTDHDELRWMSIQNLHTLHWIAPDRPVVAALQAEHAANPKNP
jgi:8-oxo-dGTP diphosphatase